MDQIIEQPSRLQPTCSQHVPPPYITHTCIMLLLSGGNVQAAAEKVEDKGIDMENKGAAQFSESHPDFKREGKAGT